MTDLLDMRNLVAGYGYGPDIVQDFNLRIKKSEVKCIIGPNGAGKSTVLKAIAGVLKPRTGAVEFEGENIAGKEAYQIMRQGICFLPQERAIFSNMTVSENLKMGTYSLQDKRLAEERIHVISSNQFKYIPAGDLVTNNHPMRNVKTTKLKLK